MLQNNPGRATESANTSKPAVCLIDFISDFINTVMTTRSAREKCKLCNQVNGKKTKLKSVQLEAKVKTSARCRQHKRSEDDVMKKRMCEENTEMKHPTNTQRIHMTCHTTRTFRASDYCLQNMFQTHRWIKACFGVILIILRVIQLCKAIKTERICLRSRNPYLV